MTPAIDHPAVHNLATAAQATGRLLDRVRDEQWGQPSPCAPWTVRDLVEHLIGSCRRLAGIVSQAPLSPDQLAALRDSDQPAGQLSQPFRTAAAALLAGFDDPAVLAREFTVPIGTVPGAVVLHLATTEMLVHGWDLARATGQPAALPDDIAEVELEFSRRQMPPEGPRRGKAFGPAQPVTQDAPAIDRLAAYLGRTVS